MKVDILCHFVCLLFLTFIVLVDADDQNTQWAEDGEGGFILSGKREASNSNGRRRGHRLRSSQRSRRNAALLEVARYGNISEQEMQQFTSAPPSSEEVNCYVEVEQTVYESHPGRCVRLGSTGIHACQASGYMGINNRECVQRANTQATSRPPHVTTTIPIPI